MNDQDMGAAITSDIMKWGDDQQYYAEKMDEGGINVYLLSMNPDPLGSIAAMSGIYEGRVFRSLGDISNEERGKYWSNALATHLKAPLESVKFHFLIEGIKRSTANQLVRQRTAVFAQESLRFAVKEDMSETTPLPPTIEPDSDAAITYVETLAHVQNAYNKLVNSGVPAEDARELLPLGTPTRIHYITDLRNFSATAGNRLCTQAQFDWRIIFAKMLEAIRRYRFEEVVQYEHEWQFELIANSMLFRPVCYQIGHCPFNAEYDRRCSIRERVESFAKEGVPAEDWDNAFKVETPIKAEEWLADPNAARR